MGLTTRKQFPEFNIDEYTDEVSVTLEEAAPPSRAPKPAKACYCPAVEG